MEVERNSPRFGQLRFRVEDKLRRKRNYNYAPTEYVEFFLRNGEGSERFQDEEMIPPEIGRDREHPVLFLSALSPAEEVLRILRGPQGTAVREVVMRESGSADTTS